ncbi:MAG: hypothetical protein LM589_02875 [Thermosphaera sp.]|nr:hypothetical protein [Thermosphaera sp.]
MRPVGDRLRRGFRGVSSGILVFIVSVAVFMILSYLFINIISILQYQSTGYKRSIGYSALHELYSLILDKRGSRVYLFNAGVSDILVDKLIAVASGGETVALNPLEACNSTSIPSQSAIECSPAYEYTAVVTVDGVAIYPRSPLRKTTIEYNTIFMIPITFNFTTLEDLREDFDIDPDLIRYPRPGDKSTRGLLGLKVLRVPPGQDFVANTTVSTETPGIAFGVAIIGYDPSWLEDVSTDPSTPPRFRIMVGSPGYDGSQKYYVGGRPNPITGMGGRVHIWNFNGVVKIYNSTSGNYIACISSNPSDCSGIGLSALGVWYYGTTDLGLRIYINGYASKVSFFNRISSTAAGETSYYPYLYIGDVDGNSIPELVFTTEDAIYGSNGYWQRDYYGTDDYYCPPRGSCDNLYDYSTVPLVLKLNKIGRVLGSPDGSINGSTYAGLLLYINLFFHDNSYPDTRQLEDNERTDWVFKIMIIDEYGSNYTIREYRYQEICNYHKTRIVNFTSDNYFVKLSQSIYIPLPSSGKYWVAVAIQDPYSYERGSNGVYLNDADVTVGMELIGVIPFYR